MNHGEVNDGWIKIHPMIVTFVSMPAIEAMTLDGEDTQLTDTDRAVTEEPNPIDQAIEAVAAVNSEQGETDVSQKANHGELG